MKTIDNGNKKPGRGLPGPLRKLKDMEPAARDRLVTRGLTALVVVVVAAYALFAMLPKDNGPASPDGPNAQAPSSGAQGQDGGTDSTFTGASGSQDPYGTSGSGTTDGTPIADADGYEPTGGKTLYAIDTKGQAKFEIHIPLGYGTYNSAGGTYVKPSAMDVTADGNEPLYFNWSMPAGYASLLEHGGLDYLDGREDGDQYENSFRAIDYYLALDKDGNEMPVILARRSVQYKPEAEYPLDGVEEYYILVDCGGPLPFTGRISGYALDSGLSQRYPTLNEIARAMIVPSSEPGFPDGWDMAEGMTARAEDPMYGDDAGDGTDAGGDSSGPAGTE